MDNMSEQNISTPASPQIDATVASAPDQGVQNSNAAVNWENRYKETQASYTKGQQELVATKQLVAELQSRVEQLAPAADYLSHNKKFFSPEEQSKSVWTQENGIDGAFAARDQILNELRQELQETKQAANQTALWQTQQQFRLDQRRLYQEYGSEYGSEEAFAEALKAMPSYDPTWEANYLQQPGYETLKRSYYVMRGAVQYDQNSPIAKQIKAREQEDFFRKQSNYLGSGHPTSYGPNKENPNTPYLSPISQS